MKSMFKTSPVFEANKVSKSRVVINQGGTSSSKTYSIIQLLFILAIESSCIITVAGQDIPNLKKGALRDALAIYNNTPTLKKFVSGYNKTERIFEFYNGSIMEFNSYTDEQDAKSGKRDYLFVNEANGISWEVYWQLDIRTRRQIFIDYNPSCKFWVHDNLIGKPNAQLIISDHRHNPFLTKEEHEKIEGIADRDYWKVYARGLTGKIEGLLFPESDLKLIAPSMYDAVQGEYKLIQIDPADQGTDDFAGGLFLVYDNRIVLHDVIYTADTTEITEPLCLEQIRSFKPEMVNVEGNGGWAQFGKSLRAGTGEISPDTQVRIYHAVTNKNTRILAQSAFIKSHFYFRDDYKKMPMYAAFMRNLTAYLKQGTSKHDDAPDMCAGAAKFFRENLEVFA